MSNLSPVKNDATPMQVGCFKVIDNKCHQILKNKKNELKLNGIYIKYGNFSPKKACKCHQIPHFGDTWCHLSDIYSHHPFAWCYQIYGKNYILVPFNLVTHGINPLGKPDQVYFALLLSGTKCHIMSLNDVTNRKVLLCQC
jgi:hypothetical protein